jgi:hypothetical protein
MRIVFFLFGSFGVTLEAFAVFDHGLASNWPYYSVAGGVLLAVSSPFAPTLSRHLYRGGRPISAVLAAGLAIPLVVVVIWAARGRIVTGIERAAQTARVVAAKAGVAQTASEIAKGAYERAVNAEKIAKKEMDAACSGIRQIGKNCLSRQETHRQASGELKTARSDYLTAFERAAETPSLGDPKRASSASETAGSSSLMAWAIPSLLFALSALCITAAITPIKCSTPPPLGTLLVDFATARLCRASGAAMPGHLLYDVFLRWAAEHGHPAVSYNDFLTMLARLLDHVDIGAEVVGDEVRGLLPRN